MLRYKDIHKEREKENRCIRHLQIEFDEKWAKLLVMNNCGNLLATIAGFPSIKSKKIVIIIK